MGFVGLPNENQDPFVRGGFETKKETQNRLLGARWVEPSDSRGARWVKHPPFFKGQVG